MCAFDRRTFVAFAGGGIAGALMPLLPVAAFGDRERFFVAEAARMKSEAVAAGDQPFGAVVVKAGAIVGYGPSRVIVDRNPDAHAERVALWDAQRRLQTKDLSGTVIYATSRPCTACEQALSLAGVGRMYLGPDAKDGGRPRHG